MSGERDRGRAALQRASAVLSPGPGLPVGGFLSFFVRCHIYICTISLVLMGAFFNLCLLSFWAGGLFVGLTLSRLRAPPPPGLRPSACPPAPPHSPRQQFLGFFFYSEFEEVGRKLLSSLENVPFFCFSLMSRHPRSPSGPGVILSDALSAPAPRRCPLPPSLPPPPFAAPSPHSPISSASMAHRWLRTSPSSGCYTFSPKHSSLFCQSP